MRLFKVFFKAAALTVVLMAMAAARADEYKTNAPRCGNNKTNPDLSIGACTWLLNFGQLTEKAIPIAFLGRGSAYRRKGQYDRAIKDYTEAIRLRPDNAFAFRLRGDAYSLNSQHDQAIKDYTEAIRLKPDDAFAFNNRGSAYRQKGQYDRAIKDYTEVIRLKPDDAWAYKNRGNVYLRKADHDAAMRDYKQAISLKPDHARIHNGIAWELATTPDPGARNGAEAVRLAKKAVSLQDRVALYHDTLAAAYAEAGRFEDAVAEQYRAITMLHVAGKNEAIAHFQSRLDLYRQRRPYRK